jgi:apolipoprotein D and lipocalin family protein
METFYTFRYVFSKEVRVKITLLSLIFGTLVQSAFASETVPHVDLNRYAGKWYEIAAIPQSFQRQCVTGTTAVYNLLNNGLVQVINSCTKADGTRNVAQGRAYSTDPVTNSKLIVTFVKIIDWVFLFGGDYWIIDLDQNYQHVLVGSPNKDYSWILARNPKLGLNKVQMRKFANTLSAKGYDTCKILMSRQPGSLNTRPRLCDYARF